MQGPQNGAEPIWIRPAVGVDKRKDISFCRCGAGVAGGAGAGSGLVQQARAGVAGDDLLGQRRAAVVDDDDLKLRPVKRLGVEAAQAGFQAVGLIQVWNNNGNHCAI